MDDQRTDDRSQAKKAVDWQNRWVTPVLLVVAIVIVGLSAAAGGLSWWIAGLVIVGAAASLGLVLSRRSQLTGS